MLNNGKHDTCGFGDEIVSYIYDEITAAGRRKFEMHLADCTLCTDEFAAISNARFSVFEWQKEEFADMPTPQFLIPYPEKAVAVSQPASPGLFAGLRELLSFSKWPVTVAAALAICVGLGFLTMTYLGRNDAQIAANKISDVPVPPVVSGEEPVGVGSTRPVIAENTKTVEPAATLPIRSEMPGRESRPVRIVGHQSPISKQMTAETQRHGDKKAVQDPAPSVRNAPVLSTYDDNDDKSLRLSDLFDSEVGAKR